MPVLFRAVLGALLIVGFTVVPHAQKAEALDVYTTPGTHDHNGRLWRTSCEMYSTSVERCRTEIEATTVEYTGGRYVQRYGWAFNNLTYKPSPRAHWIGNPLATPGEHTSGGRRWKTECDTDWTGLSACRSSIWMTTYVPSSRGYVAHSTWVFNNIIRFSDGYPTANVCTPGTAVLPAAEVEESAEPEATPTDTPTPTLTPTDPPTPTTSPTPTDTFAPKSTEAPAPIATDSPSPEQTITPEPSEPIVPVASATPSPSSHASPLTEVSPEVEILAAASASTVTVTAPSEADPLAPISVTGQVTPAVAGALVSARASTPQGWLTVGHARTAADGSYSIANGYSAGTLGSHQIRVCVTLDDGSTAVSAAVTVERARLANAQVTNTTAADVAGTYRAGCPVGPSGLSTIRINHQGMDGRIYRGEMVVRRARASEVVDVFDRSLKAGFPIAQMTNVNAFGADDIRSMAANNSSAFNCRSVVGNPYRLSPHSYGYAVDVNPVQNPYRDPTGRWHPSTQYVKRTPVVPGMLTSSSAPVVAFKSHGWRWFSGWDWHHFEKR